MARPEPETTTACNHCGKMFVTSAQHPRKYCSISCEEGKAPLPISDPRSPDYHFHIKSNPKELIGKMILASALKLVNYSPDWARGPDGLPNREVVWHDPENELYARKDDAIVGKVIEYDGRYTVKKRNVETGHVTTRRIADLLVVSQIRNGRWWVDG